MRRRRILVASGILIGFGGCLGNDSDTENGEVFGVGEIEVIISGEELDLSADRFQAEYADDHAIEFHLHEFDDYWYMEGDRRVTAAEALDKLPEFAFEVDEDGRILQIDDETYDSREPDVTIEVRINGEIVEPAEYTLEDGDEILVEVQTA